MDAGGPAAGSPLPHIIGGQSAYTWVVTATLLSMTASTPLWGKLADRYNKKALVQIALIIFVLASACAGLSQNAGILITYRVVQGVRVGGLSTLAQIVMAAMISPRERGRCSGYLSAAIAPATLWGLGPKVPEPQRGSRPIPDPAPVTPPSQSPLVWSCTCSCWR